jgi:adenosylmethionine-8-amino-7-oxononanoate aminotransferase
MEAFWNVALVPLQQLSPVYDIRCLGTVAAVESNVPGGYLADLGRRMRQVCLEHGVLLRPLGNVLYAMPPFCTSENSLHAIALAMKKAVEAVR